jgi:glutathionylspermidine synthase
MRTQDDKQFITSAITLELFEIAKQKEGYIDNYGMIHFYDMCVDIANEIIDNDEEYKKFVQDKNHFQNVHNTCFDWYCIDKASDFFTDDRILRVAGLN